MSAQHRIACAACGSTVLSKILDLGSSPLANTYREAVSIREERYPLAIGVCGVCQTVQSLVVIPDELIYGGDYGFYSGGSAPQLAYHKTGADLLLYWYPNHVKRLVVEVACNDGSLLTLLEDAGGRVVGIDPAAGPVEKAREKGLRVYQEPLTTALAVQVRAAHGPAGLVVAYQCMAHVGDLPGTLTAIRALMDERSLAVFEVQYLPDLMAGNMYDQVYHEHRFFWSLTALQIVCEKYGLYLHDAELIELQGGGLRVVLSTDPSAPLTLGDDVHMIMQRESWLPFGYGSLQGQVDRTKQHLVDLLEAEMVAGRRVAGYGASAKACTIVNSCDIADMLEYIVDATPHKQGKYLPGTNVPIVPPGWLDTNPVDTMVLLTTNYLGPILRRGEHQGRWITPLPLPAVL